jgi:hypothetical protein
MQSKVIFENQFYVACALYPKAGPSPIFTVQSKRKKSGIGLQGDEAIEWINGIETAMDAKEAHDLCSSLIRSPY